MVYVLGFLGILVALVVLAVVLVPIFIDEAALIALAQDAVRKQTGGELRIDGETSLSLFPQLALEINDAAISIPAKTQYEQSISADLQNLSIGVALLPALSGTAELDALTIRGVNARITAPQAVPAAPAPLPDLSDREWERMGRALRSEREAARRKMLADGGSIAAVAIVADVLDIRDITLSLLDANGRLDTELTLERLIVRDINTQGAPVRLEAVAAVKPSGDTPPLQIELNGTVRVARDLSTVDIDGLEALIEGALSAPVRATLVGKLVPSPLDFNATLDAELPGGQIAGTLRYAALRSPQIDVVIDSDRLDLDKIQPAGGAASAAEGPPTEGQSLPPIPLPVGPLRMLDLDLKANAAELLTAGQTIGNAQLAMRVIDGIATLNYLRGTLHDGQLETSAVINTRRRVAEVAVEGEMKGVNLGSLLTSLGNPDTMSGRVDMVWDVETEGVTADDLKLRLDGDFDVLGADVIIEAASLQGLMCDAISRINQEPLTETMPTSTPLSALALHVDFADGRADIDALTLATPGMNMAGDGAVALSNLDFNLVINTRLDKTLAELDPACEVRDRYLAVDWPVVCNGNLSGPPAKWCGVDANRIAEQLLRNEAKNQLEKNADKIGEKASELFKKLIK